MQTILVRQYGYNDVKDTVEQKMYNCGRNTGNLIWYESLKEHIKYDIEKYWENIDEKSNTKYIFPLANHLIPEHMLLEYEAGFLKSDSDQAVLIGLGTQLTSELDTPKKLVSALSKEKIRALQKMSFHSNTIGIRGNITGECLELIGIKNYRIIGCPSFYSLGEEFCQIPTASKGKICFNMNAEGVEGVASYLNLLFEQYTEGKQRFIMQSMGDFPKTIIENLEILPRHIEERLPGLKMTAKNFTEYIKNNSSIFFEKKPWLDYLRKSDFTFSIGTRFHGNMIALLAGTPTLWITHDSRTEELCEALKLPQITIREVIKIKDLEELVERCTYNDIFYKNYKKLFDNYMIFLEENEIEFT